MEAIAVIATAVAAPIIILPAVFVGYITFGAAFKVRKAARKPVAG